MGVVALLVTHYDQPYQNHPLRLPKVPTSRHFTDLAARTGSVEADSGFRGCAGCVGIVEGFVRIEDLRVGDVVRVPGFTTTKKPARLTVVKDDSEYDDNPTISISACKRMWHYAKLNFDGIGTFWAIERDGVQIHPNPGDKNK